MTLRTRLNALPLSWKLYAVIMTLLTVVVGFVELIVEPLAKKLLAGMYGGFQPWHEVVIWAVSILFPSLACGYILSKILSLKLDRMVRVARALSHGNLQARMPVTGNSNDAFDLLARSFNTMGDAIETQLHNERRLLADISHELRSPLTRMTIALELLKRGYGNGGPPPVALRLEKEMEHMGELVSLLLIQARDKISVSGAAGAVDVGAVLIELIDDFAFQGEAQKKMVWGNVEGRLTVRGNPMLLRRMLENLLSNAVFYTPAGSVVYAAAKYEDEKVVITIRDHGPGVPEEQLEDIFRAFYRVDCSRARSSGGVGLGLALAREAALQHGGNMAAANASPGLLVTVTLPGFAGD